MIKYSRESFYNKYRIVFGKLHLRQVDGLDFLLLKLENSKRINLLTMHAYVLATIYWETAVTFQPVTEYGSIEYLRSKPYFPYIGRGFVQLTWKSNYRKFGDHLGIDLVSLPHLANDREWAWEILETGMTDNYGVQDPDLTSHTLEDFFTTKLKDYLHARKIINPKDYDSYAPICELALRFEQILTGCIITAADLELPAPKAKL